jgi:IS5 family transposase
MTLGVTSRQGDLLDDVTRFCDEALEEHSIYAFLHRERYRLFPDEAFADLFDERGRRSVPPSVVAVVMVLQRLEGLSDREAVERYCFDTRWRYAAGVGGYDSEGWTSFSHTVLVDMRERLRRSAKPNRIFDVARDAAKEAGLVGKKRVLDSTPLYDAVSTMDTVTLIRSAIRGLLKVADEPMEGELRAVLRGGDDYATADKPQIDWDDPGAREALIDSRAKDAYALLVVLDGRALGSVVTEAATLLATVVGQDIEEASDGVLRIVRGVAADRIISTVDTDARHGRKTGAKGFDGYKGHAAIDPDSEIITETVVTAANVGDAAVAEDLIVDLLADDDGEAGAGTGRAVYGDNAYGTGPFLQRLEDEGIESRCKTQSPTAPGGLFAKDRFDVDVRAGTVTCPNGVTVTIRHHRRGGGMAEFKGSCRSCPLRDQCTTSEGGRSVSITAHEEALARARARQSDPAWRSDYRATRPKVERKLAHLMRRRHGGRRARMRGRARVDADFNLLAGAANLARLAVLGVRSTPGGWATDNA